MTEPRIGTTDRATQAEEPSRPRASSGAGPIGSGQAILTIGLPMVLLIHAASVLGRIFGGEGVGAPANTVDFAAFWAAARLALAGEATQSYDWVAFAAFQSTIFAQDFLPGGLSWLNPPSFLLVLAPFASLPFRWAWLAWSLVSVALAVLAVRALLPRWSAGIVFILTPGAIFSMQLGQNGLLTASLLGLALAWMDRRPFLAGVCIGLLSCKPQFGLILPPLLIVTQRWRVFWTATGTVILLVIASSLAFGAGAWEAFFSALGAIAGRLQADIGFVFEFQSVRTALLDQGLTDLLASIIHVTIAVAVTALTILLWRRAPVGRQEAAAAATLAATFLATPYSLPYDATILAMAGIFLVRAALRDGWLHGELALGSSAVLLTALPLWLDTHVAGPVAAAMLLGLAARRGWRADP